MNLLIAILIVFVFIELVAIAALTLSNFKLWIEHEALKKSTHQITYIDPLQQNFQKPVTGEEEQEVQNFQTDLDDIG